LIGGDEEYPLGEQHQAGKFPWMAENFRDFFIENLLDRKMI
jgi:hypothetical protein